MVALMRPMAGLMPQAAVLMRPAAGLMPHVVALARPTARHCATMGPGRCDNAPR